MHNLDFQQSQFRFASSQVLYSHIWLVVTVLNRTDLNLGCLSLLVVCKSGLGREREILHDILYMWNLKINTNELTKEKETYRLRQ